MCKYMTSFIEFTMILNETQKQPFGAELFFIQCIVKILAKVLEKNLRQSLFWVKGLLSGPICQNNSEWLLLEMKACNCVRLKPRQRIQVCTPIQTDLSKPEVGTKAKIIELNDNIAPFIISNIMPLKTRSHREAFWQCILKL